MEMTLEGSNSAETFPPGVGGVRLHTGKICEVSGSKWVINFFAPSILCCSLVCDGSFHVDFLLLPQGFAFGSGKMCARLRSFGDSLTLCHIKKSKDQTRAHSSLHCCIAVPGHLLAISNRSYAFEILRVEQ